MAPPTELKPLLSDLRTELEDLYGDRLVRIVLYGSQVRGDAHAESDVDVLVVLNGSLEPGAEIRRMGPVRTQVGLQYEKALSLLPVSETDYESQDSPWLQNIRKDGYVV